MPAYYKECTVQSAFIVGANAVPVSVEVVISNGLPGFSIVGMTDVAIQEARERVRAAIRGCGYSMPSEKIVVNLAPGSLKKSGSGFDLPIALGLLIASGQVSKDSVRNKLFVGELSLEGQVRPVAGMIAFQEMAFLNEIELVSGPFCPFPLKDGGCCVSVLHDLGDMRTMSFSSPSMAYDHSAPSKLDFGDVGGNEQAKRALQIAAAGNHGLLMVGPPGSGKTMLASRLPSILPSLGEREKFESAKIHSIMGESIEDIYRGIRPYRSPHHSATCAGMIGGSNPVRPGEASLAHNGVLFLDEIMEFKPSVLQALRKPLEDGFVYLTRADTRIEMPSRFMLIAACNPCPCGYFGDDRKECICSIAQVNQYQNRMGGPLLDRIDMRLDVWRSDFAQVAAGGSSIGSKRLKEGVERGRRFAFQRWHESKPAEQPNSVRQLLDACMLTHEAKTFLEGMVDAHAMSGRGISSALRISRTIADIDESTNVEDFHVAEALSLRLRSSE